MTQNKRCYPRAPLAADAIIYLGSSRLMCTTVDVGLGGIALNCPFPSEPGTFLQIDFTLPNVPRWVSAKALLVRNQQNESSRIWGLKFKTLHRSAAKLISEYVDHKLSA